MTAPLSVRVRCPKCHGTLSYEERALAGGTITRTCYDCTHELAPGEAERIARAVVEALVNEFDHPINPRVGEGGPGPLYTMGLCDQYKSDVKWWRDKLALFGPTQPESNHHG